MDWLTAEERLDALGLGYLTDRYELRLHDGSWLKVRLAEVSRDGIRVKNDDWGNTVATEPYYTVDFPVDRQLLRNAE